MLPSDEALRDQEAATLLSDSGEEGPISANMDAIKGVESAMSEAKACPKFLEPVMPHPFRSSQESVDAGPSAYTHVSASAVQSAEHGAHHPEDDGLSASALPPMVPSHPWRARGHHIWLEYKGMVLMIIAQLFGAGMSTTARYLQTLKEDIPPMSTFQVLFIRMSVTMAASLVYMWWAKVPNAPFGPPSVRYLLLARGFGGFFGVFGLYYALIYLPLADATVITFLAPLLAAWFCSILIKTPFTRVQKIAGFISLAGVVLIAQPFHFLKHDKPNSENVAPPEMLTRLLGRAYAHYNVTISTQNTTIASESTSPSPGANKALTVTPVQRAIAVAMSLLGVCGAACAYTCITWIGKRAHPLISVNYFATWCTLVSSGVLLFWPTATFRLPADWREWILISFLGASGFILQFLLTTALSHDRNRGKSLNMVYTQMLFALTLDKLVWGTTPGALSIVGSSMILGSAIWVTVAKEQPAKSSSAEPEVGERARNGSGSLVERSSHEGQRSSERMAEEEAGLVAGMVGHDDHYEDEDVHVRRTERSEC